MLRTRDLYVRNLIQKALHGRLYPIDLPVQYIVSMLDKCAGFRTWSSNAIYKFWYFFLMQFNFTGKTERVWRWSLCKRQLRGDCGRRHCFHWGFGQVNYYVCLTYSPNNVTMWAYNKYTPTWIVAIFKFNL